MKRLIVARVNLRIITICAVVCLGLMRIASATLVDLAANESGTATPALGSITTFERYDPDPATGTGVFKPFVRIQFRAMVSKKVTTLTEQSSLKANQDYGFTPLS